MAAGTLGAGSHHHFRRGHPLRLEGGRLPVADQQNRLLRVAGHVPRRDVCRSGDRHRHRRRPDHPHRAIKCETLSPNSKVNLYENTEP